MLQKLWRQDKQQAKCLEDNLPWDHLSDQPHVIRNKSLRKLISQRYLVDNLKLISTNLLIFPVTYLHYLVSKRATPSHTHINTRDFFGLGVNIDDTIDTSALIDMVKELDCHNITIRIPISAHNNLTPYLELIDGLKDTFILFNILQDREHIVDEQKRLDAIHSLFSQLQSYSSHFQIGNAINRKKWGFFSIDEYLRFYASVYALRNKHFPNIKLTGSSVIDFEFHFTIRSLYNFFSIRYDEVSALLYVDRRGAPENHQTFISRFNLIDKVQFLKSILTLSRQSKRTAIITETNWPLSDTGHYSPTGPNDITCVDLDDYANFMVRYFILTLSTGTITQVYWHQLVAPGYGLVDARESLIKYPAYGAYKFMLATLQDAEFISLHIDQQQRYTALFKDRERNIRIVWTHTEDSRDGNNVFEPITHNEEVFDIQGKPIQTDAHSVTLTQQPLYVIST